MELKDKIIVVTGAAGGIGKAMALRFAKEGAKSIICADIDAEGAAKTASEVNGISFAMDAAKEVDIANVIESTEEKTGPIDLFCSNAGISIGGGVEVPNEGWQKIWNVNLMSHVWAARHLIPRMSKRGGGYLLNTASAAGLLNQVGSAPYGVTKHAAIGLGEWLAMTYADQGIKVSVLCPQAVRTEMTRGLEDHVASIDGMLEPLDVAEFCVQGLREESFLILPHPQVKEYMRNKTDNYDRWIAGMRKLNRRYGAFEER